MQTNTSLRRYLRFVPLGLAVLLFCALLFQAAGTTKGASVTLSIGDSWMIDVYRMPEPSPAATSEKTPKAQEPSVFRYKFEVMKEETVASTACNKVRIALVQVNRQSAPNLETYDAWLSKADNSLVSAVQIVHEGQERLLGVQQAPAVYKQGPAISTVALSSLPLATPDLANLESSAQVQRVVKGTRGTSHFFILPTECSSGPHQSMAGSWACTGVWEEGRPWWTQLVLTYEGKVVACSLLVEINRKGS